MPIANPISVYSQLLGDGVWVDGGDVTNPADQTVLVDTGPLPVASYLLSVSGSGSVAFTYQVQHRDSTNTVTLHAQTRRCAAGNEDYLFGNKIPVSPNDRVRAVLQGATVGIVGLSLHYNQVAQ
jgi:hypothetical protein